MNEKRFTNGISGMPTGTTSNWVYIIITMCQETNEPLIRLATQSEKMAREYYLSIESENPMFYIQKLKNDL